MYNHTNTATTKQQQTNITPPSRSASYKFAGSQKIVVSQYWGFTRITREKYTELRSKDLLIDRGAHVKIKNGHGPLTKSSVLKF